MDEALTEAERYPWLTEGSRRLLRRLHEHPDAPRYNHRCGDRLSAAGLARVRDYAREVASAPPAWQPGEVPRWLREYAAFCFRQVPVYREYGAMPRDFFDIPTCERADLSRAPWAFVPDSQPLDDLIVYNTSGTTGHPLDVLSHPETASAYLPLLQEALGAYGVRLEGGQDPATGEARVSLVLVCWQRRTFTYASVSAFLEGAGFAKVNLNPAEWAAPEARARFLDDCQPEVYTGDPLSFAELARLPLRTRPKALISTAMQLLPGLRQALEGHFGCPVLDLYAMNEAGPIAVWTAGAAGRPAGYQLLQPRLYVEVLDEAGAPCPPGVRGEIVLSGGFNPFLPLLRYRTGDWASLHYAGAQPRIVDLEGRQPVVFRAADGRTINNIDVTWALKRFALPYFRLHQAADGELRLSVPPDSAPAEALGQALREVFGPEAALSVEVAGAPLSRKQRQYTSELCTLIG